MNANRVAELADTVSTNFRHRAAARDAIRTAVNEAYAKAQESAVDAVMMWHDEPGPCAAVRSAIEALKLP